MILLLGDRYGYRPGADVIRNALIRQIRTSVENDDEAIREADELLGNDSDISITELEIRYGAFCEKHGGKVLFCLRNTDGENIPDVYKEKDKKSREKLSDLKTYIKDHSVERCKNDSEHFLRMEYKPIYKDTDTKHCYNNSVSALEDFVSEMQSGKIYFSLAYAVRL
ncbi:MAG: hypothetical protein LUC41_02430 [Clostridiales bacterium]|nr:hypothetical protein [Clostridiales bacterium]